MQANNIENISEYHIRLTPHKKIFDMKLGELWEYRDLVVLLTRKSFTVTYQQTVLGPLWILVHPLLSCLIYMFIFGHIAQIGTGGIPQVLFYFVSSAVWELFAFSLNVNSNTFVANAYLFSKVYFPRLAVPVSNMFVSLLKFCVQMLIIAVIMAVYIFRGDVHPLWAYFPLLPLLFLQLSLLGMGAGILISSLTTKYKDLLHVVGILVSFLMYASPVVYPISTLSPGILKTLIRINPVSEPIELIRKILLGSGEFELSYYLLSVGITIVLLVISAAIFNMVEKTFEDTV